MSEISAFGINFSRFELLNLKKSNCITRRIPTLRQKLEEKSASYTQASTVIANLKNIVKFLFCNYVLY